MDESPDVAFYVLAEPALSAPEPDEWGIWQENAHLRDENYQWRECVSGILSDVEQLRFSPDALRAAIQQRVAQLGQRLAHLHRQDTPDHR